MTITMAMTDDYNIDYNGGYNDDYEMAAGFGGHCRAMPRPCVRSLAMRDARVGL